MKMKSPEELKKHFEPLFQNIEPENVIVYCGSGVTSILNQIAMEHAGFGEARVYIGSWSEWITDQDAPIATGEENN
jgi:thiosulfate/3-mercaptopyruvate sulfurtransferase